MRNMLTSKNPGFGSPPSKENKIYIFRLENVPNPSAFLHITQEQQTEAKESTTPNII
jgi:hypothetical protein